MSHGGLAEPVLSVQGLSKRFAGFSAVDQMNFDLPRGAMAGLIGPNGAGKTTLFNAIAGGLRADEGRVILDGTEIQRLPAYRVHRQGLARTFQIPRPFLEMSVLENVMLAPSRQSGERYWNNWLRPRAVAREERALRGRAEEIIAFCGLATVLKDAAKTLSGGQLKLLELARVLIGDPKVILLDEPAAGVNPRLLESLVDKIVALNQQGYSFLVIEHNMDVVMSLCDPIVVMARGKRIFLGDATAARADAQVLDAYLGQVPT